jgi:hypothetical protein
MVLLNDEAQVEAHFGSFVVLILTQDRCTVCADRTIGSKNHFGCTRWNSKMIRVMCNLMSVRSKMVLVSVQERCMACTKRTIGSRIILDAPGATPR